LGKLLITPVGMFMSQHHNLGTHDQLLAGGMGPNQPTQMRGILFGQLDGRTGLGSTHDGYLPSRRLYALNISLSSSERIYDSLY
jgi:hypothetical protein